MVRCSVYIVCPSVLSYGNFILYQTLEAKKEKKNNASVNINSGVTLSGFQTTRPSSTDEGRKVMYMIKCKLNFTFPDPSVVFAKHRKYIATCKLLSAVQITLSDISANCIL